MYSSSGYETNTFFRKIGRRWTALRRLSNAHWHQTVAVLARHTKLLSAAAGAWLSARFVCKRSWPQAAEMSWPFSRRRVATAPCRARYAGTFPAGCAKVATIQTFNSIVGNEINFGRKPTHVLANACACASAVVYAGDQDVFKHQPFLLRDVVVAGLEESREVVFAVDRHDLAADFIGRPVKRDG